MQEDDLQDQEIDARSNDTAESLRQKTIDAIQSETKKWEWLTNVSTGRVRLAGVAAYNYLVASPANQALNSAEKGMYADPIKFHDYYINSNSPEGKLITAIRESGEEIIALCAFILITPARRETCRSADDIMFLMNDPMMEYERVSAINIINNFYGTTEIAEQAGVDSVFSVATDFKSQVDKYKKEIAVDFTSYVVAHKNTKKKLQKEYDSIRYGVKRRARFWNGILRKTVNNAKDQLGDAQAHLNSAKEAYSAQIDLKASVEYWTERRESHKTSTKVWFGGVIASMIATFIVMMLYFRFGVGLLGAAPKKTSEATGAASPLAIEDVVSAASHFFVAALLLTFLGIIVRIALRQYNTHSNCALEAQERVTFTKTYLALMHEGKLTADADRKLVLESLFRPNSFSSSPEIVFSTPIEMIYKAAERAKP